jgi:putative redox protein
MTTMGAIATFADPAAGSRVDAAFGSGFSISYDTAASGRARSGPSPTETLLGALASCTSLDVASILRKKRQAVRGYQVAVSAERRDEHPQVFTSIVVEHRLVGDVEIEAVRRSIELSATRYCPVNAMLSPTVHIEHRYRVWPASGEGDGVAGLVLETGPSPVSQPAEPAAS